MGQVFHTLPDIEVDGGRSSSGNLIVGQHAITPRNGLEQLGYSVVDYVDGILTVTPKSAIGAAGGLDTKPTRTNQQSVKDTNTRYLLISPIAKAPVKIVSPPPAVTESIQSSVTAAGPAVSVLITDRSSQASGETFITATEEERKKRE